MINPFNIGDSKAFRRTVCEADIARFESGVVHHVYSTFALGRDAEWACRLFVLEMKEAGEEGIGTWMNVRHRAPALLGETVDFRAVLEKVDDRKVDCSFTAHVGERLVAEGGTGQMVLPLEKLDELFKSLQHG